MSTHLHALEWMECQLYNLSRGLILSWDWLYQGSLISAIHQRQRFRDCILLQASHLPPSNSFILAVLFIALRTDAGLEAGRRCVYLECSRQHHRRGLPVLPDSAHGLQASGHHCGFGRRRHPVFCHCPPCWRTRSCAPEPPPGPTSRQFRPVPGQLLQIAIRGWDCHIIYTHTPTYIYILSCLLILHAINEESDDLFSAEQISALTVRQSSISCMP